MAAKKGNIYRFPAMGGNSWKSIFIYVMFFPAELNFRALCGMKRNL